MSIRGFAQSHGYSRETLRDWVNAYNHLEGSFIRIDNINENQDNEESRIIMAKLDGLFAARDRLSDEKSEATLSNACQ